MSGFNTFPDSPVARAHPCRRLAAAALATIVIGTALEAAGVERAMSQYLRDQWGSERGYPGGPVYAIAQGADGYLWIGAEKGLVRFDGLSFRLFEPKGLTAGAGPTVFGVTAASDGSVWVRPRGVELLRLQDGAFESLLPGLGSPSSVVSAMQRGRGARMLLATLSRGALAYDNGRFDVIAAPDAMPSSSFVIAIAEGANGEVWLGTRGAGLLRAERGRVTRITEGLPDLKVNCLLPDGSGELWIGTDKGIARWTGSVITREGIPDPLQGLPALAMIRDRGSNVWIAAGARGLLRMNARGMVAPADPAGPATRHVSTVFEDRDGNLWVGTDRGVERWRDPVFTTFSTAQGLPGDGVGPIYVDRGGRTWFAPTTGGLFWIEDGVVRRADAAELDRDVIYSIDGGGDEVWIGRQRGGLTRLRPSTGGIGLERFTHRHGLAQDSVYAVRLARDGAVWAGTLSGGASRFKEGTFTTYTARDGLASNTVAAILEARDGTVWFGTPGGLSAWSRGAWRTFTTRDGLPANDVNTLFEDSTGTLWVGTTAGAALVRDGRVSALRGAPAPSGSIHGFAEDGLGFLWITTADSIVSAKREAWLAAPDALAAVRRYGTADGLLALESVKRHRTLLADSGGRIWVALTRGLAVADPAAAGSHTLPALTHVESLTVDGDPVALVPPIKVASSRRRVALSYSGLSLSVPERVMFRYRLDGFDRDWSEPVPDRQAVYTNLRPGPYRFRVLASNSDGVWNGAESTLAFAVQPMFWQTAPFQALMVALCAAAGWGLYRLRLLQMARRLQVRFDERLAERTRIAQELHDTLLQGFLSASMQLHVAADALPGDSPVRSQLGRVLDLMGRVIEEGRNAVRGLRAGSSAAHDLEGAFSEIPGEFAGGPFPAFRVIVEGRSRRLTAAIRDEVYRIGREAVVNAFRHAGAERIEIELEYAARELRLFVRDDGRGMPAEAMPSAADGHWGITGMHERAERVGATLRIRSRAAAGTEVELRVPGHLAFERDPSDRTRWRPHVLRQISDAPPPERQEKQP